MKEILFFCLGFTAASLIWGGEAVGADAEGETVVRILRNGAAKCGKAFDPPQLRVKLGTSVTFRNEDWQTHTVVSGGGEDPCNFIHDPIEKRELDLGQVGAGGAVRHAFTEPGTYTYMCHLPGHHMAGEITVVP